MFNALSLLFFFCERVDFDLNELYKEVQFDKYCKKCKHKIKNENEEPCDECLSEPTNLYSEKPIKYKEINV